MKKAASNINHQVHNKSTLMIGRWSSWLLTSILFVLFITVLPSCKVYKFRDIGGIPADVKTIKIIQFENKARYVNPQIAPRLTERFQIKVISQTRLSRSNSDDAHYQVSGYISDYTVTTAGISNQQAATNRLTVGVHITFLNTLTNKTEEFDISRNFDFAARLSLEQAQTALGDEIIRNLSDEIFNRIFSTW